MRIKTKELQGFKELAVEAARQAGKLLQENFGLAHNYAHKSSYVDLVTECDHRAQALIVSMIQHEYPRHQILSEEQFEQTQHADSNHKWIIDPLDGTMNFVHGYPLFCVSIALEVEGEVVLGVAYSPITEELFVAQKGDGSFLNSKRIRVSQVRKLSESLLATGFPNLAGIQENVKHFLNFIGKAQGIRRDGSAVLDLCYLACGRFDGFWELYLKPWDVAAGSLIIREAGGVITDFEGKAFNIYGDETLASNGLIHREMREVLKR